MLFNGRALIFTYSRTEVRIAEIERLQSLFKTSMVTTQSVMRSCPGFLREKAGGGDGQLE